MTLRRDNKSIRKAARKAKKRVNDEQHLSAAAKDIPLEVELRTENQKAAWKTLQESHVTFLMGSAGSGKTFLATAYAISEILNKRRAKIVLTRPIVEAGERLGFLPGAVGEKINPYMQPLYDTMDKLLGKHSARRELINKAIVLSPLSYMRGVTFDDAICIFDEAQNATYAQLKLFLSRFGQNTQVIVTGDPLQSDLPFAPAPLVEVVKKLNSVRGIQSVQFNNDDVVRHPIVSAILKRL